jgi:hypothetical protein
MTHPAEYEHEATRTLRLVRRTIYLALAVAVMCLLVLVAAYVVSSTGGGTLTSSSGSDAHAPFEAGATAHVTTESGMAVSVTILKASMGSSPVILASSTGAEPISAAAGRWALYFDDNTQVPLIATAVDGGRYSLSLEAPIAAGKTVRFVHYDPDDSQGDIYFDLQPR